MSTGPNAPLDENSRQGLFGLSSANDGTRVAAWFNPSTHALLVESTGGGGGVNLELPTGTVNGGNTSFTVTNTPKWLSIDGSNKFDATYNPSNPAYSYAAGTITILDGAPPVQSIVSFY